MEEQYSSQNASVITRPLYNPNPNPNPNTNFGYGQNSYIFYGQQYTDYSVTQNNQKFSSPQFLSQMASPISVTSNVNGGSIGRRKRRGISSSSPNKNSVIPSIPSPQQCFEEGSAYSPVLGGNSGQNSYNSSSLGSSFSSPVLGDDSGSNSNSYSDDDIRLNMWDLDISDNLNHINIEELMPCDLNHQSQKLADTPWIRDVELEDYQADDSILYLEIGDFGKLDDSAFAVRDAMLKYIHYAKQNITKHIIVNSLGDHYYPPETNPKPASHPKHESFDHVENFFKPFRDNGVPVFYILGNHECARESILQNKFAKFGLNAVHTLTRSDSFKLENESVYANANIARTYWNRNFNALNAESVKLIRNSSGPITLKDVVKNPFFMPARLYGHRDGSTKVSAFGQSQSHFQGGALNLSLDSNTFAADFADWLENPIVDNQVTAMIDILNQPQDVPIIVRMHHPIETPGKRNPKMKHNADTWLYGLKKNQESTLRDRGLYHEFYTEMLGKIFRYHFQPCHSDPNMRDMCLLKPLSLIITGHDHSGYFNYNVETGLSALCVGNGAKSKQSLYHRTPGLRMFTSQSGFGSVLVRNGNVTVGLHTIGNRPKECFFNARNGENLSYQGEVDPNFLTFKNAVIMAAQQYFDKHLNPFADKTNCPSALAVTTMTNELRQFHKPTILNAWYFMRDELKQLDGKFKELLDQQMLESFKLEFDNLFKQVTTEDKLQSLPYGQSQVY